MKNNPSEWSRINRNIALADPAEVKLLKKECFNRWYGLWPYYVAFTLSRLPFQIVFNVIFLSMTYWMSGLPVDGHRFALYLLVGLVVSFVAEGLGLAIGASFSITVSDMQSRAKYVSQNIVCKEI